jgi:uncharacterized protein YegJ (DUF2314 family)
MQPETDYRWTYASPLMPGMIKRPFSIALLLIAVLATALDGCSKEHNTISVAADDQEMNAAIAKARATLPQFWQTFEKREHGESDFSLKVEITDKKQTEHFWLSDIERKDGKVFGTINNDPDKVGSVKLGDRIPIPEADISDWLFMRDGKMVGNYTLRVLFKQMTEKEVEHYKKMLVDP